MKVALVCDWLTNVGGAEKVLLELHRMYPDAPIYTSQYNPKGIDWFLDADVRTGKMQKYPAKLRRVLGPMRQRWFEKLDLSGYDLVISVTGAEAKAVRAPDGVHICYCHVPTQYYWQMYDDYIQNPGFGILNPLVRMGFRAMVKKLRIADKRAAEMPDYFVTISEYSKEMIAKYYGREAVVIHPPVEVESFYAKKRREGEYYITTSRQVNWKRLDLAVSACVKLGRKLLVIGEGPEHRKLMELARGSEWIDFLPMMKKDELAGYLAGAKGYLFPSLEPFGIAPVEALAAGCPVVAYGKGGALDYVVEGENGVCFDKQTIKSLSEAILRFEKMEFDVDEIVKSAKAFGVKRFDKEMKDFVCEKTQK